MPKNYAKSETWGVTDHGPGLERVDRVLRGDCSLYAGKITVRYRFGKNGQRIHNYNADIARCVLEAFRDGRKSITF